MIRRVLRWVLAVAMVAVGVRHCTDPEPFVRILPATLPAKLALVWISGAAEVLGGVGLLVPRTRRWAGHGLIALYVAVFPANVNMALKHLLRRRRGDADVGALGVAADAGGAHRARVLGLARRRRALSDCRVRREGHRGDGRGDQATSGHPRRVAASHIRSS
jgi:uncharacterized membrane protein